jgi:nucleotide-binding universal stress UspA family protein
MAHRAFEQILVPLDGSPAAERALVPALELVRRSGVPLRLLSRALADEKEHLAGYLAELTDRYAAATDVETQVVDREAIPDANRHHYGKTDVRDRPDVIVAPYRSSGGVTGRGRLVRPGGSASAGLRSRRSG